MATWKIFTVQEQEVVIKIYPLTSLKDRNFNGQKLHHPFETITTVKTVPCFDRQKRASSRNITEMHYEMAVVHEAVEDLQTATFEMKHDGSCGYIEYNPEKNEYIPYARYDVKRDPKTKQFKTPPENAIPCEPQPTTADATHWPHFVPCSSDPKAYTWYLHAFELAKKSGKLDSTKKSFTCEYMGKKFNWKPCDGVDLDAAIVPHGLVTIDIPAELRTPEGIRAVLQELDFMEGMIVYGKNHTWKIRREMFVVGDHKLKWPSDSKVKISEQVMIV